MPVTTVVLNQFKDRVDGLPALILRSAVETKNMEAVLRGENVSFVTKIKKSKRDGPRYVITLVS